MEQVWLKIHRNPAMIGVELQAPDRIPDLVQRAEETARLRKNLADADAKRRRLLETLAVDAQDYGLAKLHYLHYGLRLAVAISVGAMVFWGAHLLYFFFGLLKPWLWLGCAALAGAILPVSLAWLLERWRGERANRAIIEKGEQADEATHLGFSQTCEMMDTAGQFCLQLRALQAARRVQWLCHRAKRIIDMALAPPSAADEENSLARAQAATSAQSEQSEAFELHEFARLTMAAPETLSTSTELEQSIEAMVEKELGELIDGVWSPVCNREDPKYAGLIAVGAMLPALHSAVRRFVLRIEAAAGKHLISDSTGAAARQIAKSIDQFESTSFWYGMSVPSPQVTATDMRRLLLVNPHVASEVIGELSSQLQDVAEDCQALSGRTLAAIAIEERLIPTEEWVTPSGSIDPNNPQEPSQNAAAKGES